jgi:hypothetical protein
MQEYPSKRWVMSNIWLLSKWSQQMEENDEHRVQGTETIATRLAYEIVRGQGHFESEMMAYHFSFVFKGRYQKKRP